LTICLPIELTEQEQARSEI